MSADMDGRVLIGTDVDGRTPLYAPAPEPAPVEFRPGQGGEMSNEWAAYALNLWWAARDKKLTFADAIKETALHFMVGDQP